MKPNKTNGVYNIWKYAVSWFFGIGKRISLSAKITKSEKTEIELTIFLK